VSTYKAHIFKQRNVGEREEVKIKIFGPDGSELDLGGGDGPPVPPGWQGVLDWQPYPLGENGWRDYQEVYPNDNFGHPMFAVYGEIVFLRGALNGQLATGHLGALPDSAKPYHKQRLNLNSTQAFLSLDMAPDGLLKQGSGQPPSAAHIILSGMYFLTQTPDSEEAS